MELNGRRVVVTGASQGIGEHLALRFAQHGAEVLVVARSADKLRAVAERTGGSWIAADLTDAEQVDSLVDRCIERLGHVDVWVNNAGTETDDAFVHVERADLRDLARLNFEATLLLTRDVLPHMIRRGGGHVVQVSSVSGTASFPGLAAYAGSKAGITNFTEVLRLELEGYDIGLTVVAPGPVATHMWERIEEDGGGWSAPALRRFRRLFFLPKVDPADLAVDVVSAVERGKRFVRPKKRYGIYHVLNNLPRRLVEIAMTGVRMPPLRVGEAERSTWQPIWVIDNPPSRDWTLYTRGNVGEVFPEVVLPLTWSLFGGAAERGWKQAFEQMGLLMPGDLDPEEEFVVLGVFGGYCYINASYVRLLGVRAPGGTVDAIDTIFFGESDAPSYRSAPGHTNRRSTLRLARTVLRLLGTTEVPGLLDDQAEVAAFVSRTPGDDAADEELLAHLRELAPLFERLFARHIDNTFSVALVSGALSDLCAKAGHADQLVTLLGGIGDVESAAPSAAMWELAVAAQRTPVVAAAFDGALADGFEGLLERLRAEPDAGAWLERFDRFLDQFGSRGPNEWDMGSDPWEFRPELALAAIDRMRTAAPEHEPARQVERLVRERAAAVERVRSSLNPVDRFQFDKALRATTLFSQARERSKTTVILAVHGARRAQRELARRMADRGGPTERWLTCLLTDTEFQAALADPGSYAELIASRAEQHRDLSGRVPPFIVEGEVPDSATWAERSDVGQPVSVGETLRGIAGCSGVARGRARVVLDPGHPGDIGPGDVLVAPITDPSWTPLFLAVDAVVVDVGATMSHAVIVSRELGIPCVVSAVGATRRIPDGAVVEVDGNTGVVTVVELP